jgi:hypothetical protein
MTRKDYVLIANCLRITLNRATVVTDGESAHAIRGVIDDLAVELQRNNPQFNRGKFLAACRGEE